MVTYQGRFILSLPSPYLLLAGLPWFWIRYAIPVYFGNVAVSVEE